MVADEASQLTLRSAASPRARRLPAATVQVMTDQSADDRRDQLTSAPKATEADAAPRIDVTTTDTGDTRIDIREDTAVRPGRVDENGDELDESRDDA
ncbi:hypothetical protein A6122_0337 [Rathayibacter tritici]|uniref:Multidrug transporter n=2 Tax=Rathayibacter tritici TaxID=33888 RepID=A0A160KQI1_9MICO|nr:hypothetical protein A6122_0337 [Rathayibacter tritici]